LNGSGYGSYSATFHYEVIGEEVITVPLGTFVVMVVEEWAFLPGGTNRGGVYKLNQDIGPVELPGGFVLTGISGPVSIDQSSWGSVKALYR